MFRNSTFALLCALGFFSLSGYSNAQSPTIDELKEDLNRSTKLLASLHKYVANAFIWQKKILKRGQTCTRKIRQIPVIKMDGTIANGKEVLICRAHVNDNGDIVKSPTGDFVKINLYSDGMYDAGSIMMLVGQGSGAAVSCWKALAQKGSQPGNKNRVIPKYNCFFRVQPTEDGGVLMRWTMYHPAELKMNTLSQKNIIENIMHGVITDLRIVPNNFKLPKGSTFEIK